MVRLRLHLAAVVAACLATPALANPFLFVKSSLANVCPALVATATGAPVLHGTQSTGLVSKERHQRHDAKRQGGQQCSLMPRFCSRCAAVPLRP